MKPLTIDEIKALTPNDWIWIQFGNSGRYYEIFKITENCLHTWDEDFTFSDYGTKWIAYQNKEQATQNEQCVICHCDISSELPKIDKYGNMYCTNCYEKKSSQEDAECILTAIKKEKGLFFSWSCAADHNFKGCPLNGSCRACIKQDIKSAKVVDFVMQCLAHRKKPPLK